MYSAQFRLSQSVFSWGILIDAVKTRNVKIAEGLSHENFMALRKVLEKSVFERARSFGNQYGF